MEKIFIDKLVINRGMSVKERKTFDSCMEVIVSPVQKEVFLIVDEWWKRYGHSPTLRQIAYMRGKVGVGNTKEIVDRLVRIGVLKRLENRRSIRPVYINFRSIE